MAKKVAKKTARTAGAKGTATKKTAATTTVRKKKPGAPQHPGLTFSILKEYISQSRSHRTEPAYDFLRLSAEMWVTFRNTTKDDVLVTFPSGLNVTPNPTPVPARKSVSVRIYPDEAAPFACRVVDARPKGKPKRAAGGMVLMDDIGGEPIIIID